MRNHGILLCKEIWRQGTEYPGRQEGAREKGRDKYKLTKLKEDRIHTFRPVNVRDVVK
jgi:hypothetical protein